MVSPRQVLPGDPAAEWQPWGTYEDILVDRSPEGIARVAINRPAKRNAFRPQTVAELCDAFSRIRDEREIGVVLFTGVGPAADGVHAFCAGGDQSVRGDGGYVGDDGLPRLVSQQHCCHGFRISTSSSGSSRKYRCKDIGSWSRAQQVLAQGHRYLDGDGDGETCEALR